jgi:hypothetical protein
MDERSPIAFVRLGAYVRSLIGRGAEDRVDGEDRILATLGRLDVELQRLGFRVSHQMFNARVRGLLQTLHALVQAHPDSEVYLGPVHARTLLREIESLEQAIYAESETRLIAVPTNRRFNFEVLVREPHSLFAQDIVGLLPEIARTDLQQACRCIAYDCPTAGAFHILRCLEECVRMVYRAYFPRGDDQRAWGLLCNELRQKPRQPKPNVVLLTRLNELRDQFRNPTQHPEKVYTLDESQDLLHLCIELIPRCVNDLQVARKRGNAPAERQ